jgi:hypothetical protein
MRATRASRAWAPYCDTQPPIDRECLPRHERRAVRREPEYGGRHFVGRTESPDGLGRRESRRRLRATAGCPVDYRGLNHTGADGVDPDASLGVLERGGLRQAHDPVLAGDVGGGLRETDRQGGYVDVSLPARRRLGAGLAPEIVRARPQSSQARPACPHQGVKSGDASG